MPPPSSIPHWEVSSNLDLHYSPISNGCLSLSRFGYRSFCFCFKCRARRCARTSNRAEAGSTCQKYKTNLWQCAKELLPSPSPIIATVCGQMLHFFTIPCKSGDPETVPAVQRLEQIISQLASNQQQFLVLLQNYD